jgi:hypothetical protein
VSEESLYRALRNGNALTTDGPVALFSLRPKNGGKTHRLGETVLHKPGEDLELSMEWKSTPEFGPVNKIRLYLGTTKGERDITDQVCSPRSRKKGYEFEGSIEQVLSKWDTMPCYLRLEAGSGIEPETGETLFRCVTNPIWVVAG